MNQLYYGDNLTILREHLADDSVDLVYLDPPFNSKRSYNLLFTQPGPGGTPRASDAQITAFTDTWHWGEQAEREFAQILHQPNTRTAELIQALRRLLAETDLMAYLVIMTNRLLEMHRVLKATGSLYLHCDPTASHYLKLVLDGVFGPDNFRNEIVWKRQSAHNDAKRKFASLSDSILFYAKSAAARFNPQYVAHDETYVAKFYRYDDGDGRGLYRLGDMASPQPRPNLMYEWLGYACPTKGWRYEKETMQKLHDEGRIYYPVSQDGTPDYTKRLALKRYLREKGQVIGNIWHDITPLHSSTAEALGYPTQKPLALLGRIIEASSNPGDVVLDPFCGCGTAVHAANALDRRWIGIDITHLAISLIEKRLKDAFPGEPFAVLGVPEDLAAAQDLANRDKYQFQWWACSLVNAQPYQGKKKGADGGIDGLIFFQDNHRASKKILVSVKGGAHVDRAMIADLKNSVEREKAQMGLFVTLTPATAPMQKEALSAGFYQSPHNGAFPKIQILTIAGLLSGQERPAYPDWSQGQLTFKPAPRTQEAAPQLSLLSV